MRRLLAETLTEKKLSLEDYAKVTEFITNPPTLHRAVSKLNSIERELKVLC